jgi:integrase
MAILMALLRRLFRRPPLASPSPRIADLLDDWCASRLADGMQPRGVKRYRQHLEAFLLWAGADLQVAELTRRRILDYKTALGSRPTGRRRRGDPTGTLVSPGTTRNALTCLRTFCAWCIEREYLTENPALAVRHPRVIPPPPNVLSREQIRDLFRAIDKAPGSHRATWPRNRRCILLMLYAGLRREEAANLLWGDLELERRELTVRYGKGGRSRVVPICAELLAELVFDGPQPAGQPVLSTNADDLGLDHRSVGHIFERWLPGRWPATTDGELPPLVSPHQLRRTFATELYVRGVDLLTIQRLLGHSDPKTTLRYIAASSTKEHAAVELLRFRAELPATERTSDMWIGIERLQLRKEVATA